ncbi:hypothetical protein FRC17_000216 [Serendipita sp. 399]|nr:hypothetical protein FRC17_000216 [Serendipita sp. 399]
MSLFGPLQLARTRWMRGNRREAGNIRDLGTIILIIFVLIGVARALYGVYFGTRKLAQYVLTRAENAILEVQDDNDEEDSRQDRQDSHAQAAQNSSKGPEGHQGEQTSQGAGTSRSGEGVRRRPGPMRIDPERIRRAQDEFGEELPDTPGGWREEWHFVVE